MSTHRKLPACLVLFDGVCVACNGFVKFLQSHTPPGEVFFTPSQSEAGREIMLRYQIPEREVNRTVYVIEGHKAFSRSTGVLRLASHLPFPWRLASGLRVIPLFLRDAVYQIISRHRYQWFGKLSTCRIPTPEERERFIQTLEELERIQLS